MPAGFAMTPKHLALLPASKLGRILAAVGLLIVTAAAAFAGSFVMSLRDVELKSIRNRLEVPAQAMAHVLQVTAREIDLTLRETQAAIGRDDSELRSTPRLRRLILDHVYARSMTRKIEIYDRSGKPVVSSLSDPPPPVSVANYAFFQRQMAAQTDRLVISRLVADPHDGDEAVIASRPLIDDAGRVKGVVAAYIETNSIQGIFDSLRMPAGSAIVLFTREGTHLLRSPRVTLGDKILDVDFSQRASFRTFRDAGPDGAFAEFVTLAAGTSRFVAGGAGPDSEFVVTAGWDASDALAHWRSEAAIIIGFTLAGIAVVAGLFAYILAELRRNETLLAEVSGSEEKFRALMAALPDAVMIIDPSVTINFANAAAERLYGYDPGAMTGLDFSNVIAPEIRAADEEAIRRTFEKWDLTFRLQGVERIALRRDGSAFPVEINVRPYESPNGRRLVSAVRDVSKRQANDRALHRSRESLSRAQRVAGVGSFEIDYTTGEREWSDEFLRIWGITAKPAQGEVDLLTKLVHPEDRQKFTEGRDAVLNGIIQPLLDFRIIRSDGSERILHNEYSADFDKNGKPVRLFGTVQDVTERKKTELELRRSRENLARAQRLAGIGSFERNLATGEVEISDELYRIHGVTKGAPQASLSFLHTLVHPEDRAKIEEFRRAVEAGRSTPAIDYRIIRPDGVERALHRECDILFDEAGKPICLFGTLQDITDRKSIEIELRRSQENLARAHRVAALGSYDHDLTSGKAEWSDELYRLYGLTPGEGEAGIEKALSFVHPDDREKFLAIRKQAEQGIKTSSLDFRIVRADGVERILHRQSDVTFDESGRPSRMFGTLQDVTEQKRAELQLVRSRENLSRAQRLAGIGSFERDLVTGEGEWSDEFMRIWGLDHIPNGKLRDALLPLVHPDDRAKFAAARDAALHNQPASAVDFRIYRPDGQERILHPEFRVVFDDKGKPVRMFGTVQDITERKTIELELRRSRENLARAQRIAGIGSFERDLVTGKLEWSDEFLHIWGVTERPTHGTAELLLSLVHPEDREKFVEGRDAALGKKETSSLDFRIIRPDGQERILHRDYGVLFDPAGKAIRMFGTVQDITERKQIELEMQRSRENLARAQRIAAMGSFEQDLVTGVAEWSDEMHRVLGIEPGAIVPGPEALAAFIHPDDRSMFWAAREAEAARESSSTVEFRILRPDGAERVIRRESAVVRDEEGRPIRLYGTFADITERKQIELEMHRSRENLARAQRIAAMGSFERDLITGKGEWSDEMYHVLGLDKAQGVLPSETLIDLIHPDDREKFVAYRSAEINGKANKPLEYRVVRRDGTERIVRRETAVVFDEERRPSRLYGTLQDITERRLAERRERELERQLLHSQKLEALGTLAGGIAHDLNNTLVPIMALSKLTARRFEAGTLVRANLETIYEASERARDLVKRVVAFSRKDDSEKCATDMAEIVNEALKLLRATIPSSITLEAQIAKVPAIPADASQLHQIVTNLVSNAAQALGGEIGTIAVALDVVSSAHDRDEIRLSVSDTGIGMDEATQQRIFEPFFTTKAVGQGTGLGLSIVHGIIAGHGGHIEVKSAPGKGTRFDLYFPIAEAGVAAPVTSSRPAA